MLSVRALTLGQMSVCLNTIQFLKEPGPIFPTGSMQRIRVQTKNIPSKKGLLMDVQ